MHDRIINLLVLLEEVEREQFESIVNGCTVTYLNYLRRIHRMLERQLDASLQWLCNKEH